LIKNKSSLLITFLVASRILTIFAFPHLALKPDSPTYSQGGWLDFHLVSLNGHSHRGWVAPLLFALVPGSVGREILQMCISVVAWYLVYREFSFYIVRDRYKTLFAIGIAILATSSSVVQWETVLLGASFQISTTLLILALLMRLFRERKNSKALIAIEALAFLLAIEKSSNLFFSAFIIVTTSILIWRHSVAIKRLILVLASLLVLFTAFLTGTNVDKAWPTTYSGYTLLWQLGGQSPTATEFRNFLSQRKSVPSCVYQEAPYQDLNYSIGKVVNECKGGAKYVANNLRGDFIRFALTHLQSDLKLGSLGFGAALTDSSSHYGPSVQILPHSFSSIFFGEANPDHRFSLSNNQVDTFKLLGSGEPLWLYAPGIAWVLASFGVFIYAKKRKNQMQFAGLLGSIQINFLLNALIVFVLLPSEWVRQSAPFIIPSIALGLFSTFFLLSEVSNSPKS